MLINSMRVLAIDHGTKRLGFAISDENNRFAQALPVVGVTRHLTDLKIAETLVKRYKPDRIVVGIPLGLAGKPTRQSALVSTFCQKLAAATEREVLTWEETGSTLAARSSGKLKRRQSVDSEAARIILQEYLDFINTGI